MLHFYWFIWLPLSCDTDTFLNIPEKQKTGSECVCFSHLQDQSHGNFPKIPQFKLAPSFAVQLLCNLKIAKQLAGQINQMNCIWVKWKRAVQAVEMISEWAEIRFGIRWHSFGIRLVFVFVEHFCLCAFQHLISWQHFDWFFFAIIRMGILLTIGKTLCCRS